MTTMSTETFAARVARVQAGAANTKGTIFVGQDEQYHLGQRNVLPQSKAREIAGNALYPLSLLGAFGVGLLAVALGSYARFQLAAGQSELEDADLEMALSSVIGFALSFVFAQMFRLKSKEHKALQGMGVFVMVCGLHNFAHWTPGLMSMVFSPEYVARTQTETPPNSARFRGVYFPLFDAHAPAAEVTGAAAAPDGAADDVPGAGTDTVTCTEKAPAVKRIVLDHDKNIKPRKTKAGCATE